MSRTEYGYRTDFDDECWPAWMNREQIERLCRHYDFTMIARDISDTYAVTA